MHLCPGCGKRINNRNKQCKVCYKASPEHRQRISLMARGLAVDPSLRYWPKVHITDGCWNWLGHIDRYGYGEFRGNVTRKAHRYGFYLAFGYLPESVDHLCCNTQCVRPDHLRDLSPSENSRLARLDSLTRRDKTTGRFTNGLSGLTGLGTGA